MNYCGNEDIKRKKKISNLKKNKDRPLILENNSSFLYVSFMSNNIFIVISHQNPKIFKWNLGE